MKLWYAWLFKSQNAVDLQTPASIWQLNGAQVPHHLLLPGLGQRNLSHVTCDQETWSTEMDTNTVTLKYIETHAQEHWRQDKDGCCRWMNLLHLGAGREVHRSLQPSDRPRPADGCRSASLSELHLQPCEQPGSQTQTYSVEKMDD